MSDRPPAREALVGHEGVPRAASGAWPAVLLVVLVVVSPWPFGGAHSYATQAITILASVFALLGWILGQTGAGAQQPKVPVPGPVLPPADSTSGSAAPEALGRASRAAPWAARAAAAVAVLALVQLVPLPPALHAFVAPGSAAVWHPASAPAAAVLGEGARPVSIDPAATRHWFAFAAALLALALSARAGLRSRASLLRASSAAVAGALLVAVYGLVARLVFGEKLYGVLAVPTIAPFGPFVSKNHFAGYVELGACLALGLAAGLADEARRGSGRLAWLESRRAPWIVAAWGAAAVLVLAVPAALSRGGVVSLAAGVAAFAAIRSLATPGRAGERQRRRGWLAGVGAVVAAAAIVALVLPEEARARVATLGDAGRAGAYRLQVWRDALPLSVASPALGSGLGAFADALPRFKTGAGYVRVEHAENDYLELLCDGGLAALALVLAGASGLILAGLRAVRDEPHRLARGVRAGALAGLVAVLVHGLFDFNLRIPSNALFAALLAACALAAPAPSGRRPGVRAAGWPVLAALALAAAVWEPWSPTVFEPAALRRAASGAIEPALRRKALERDVVAHLQRRPADAQAWAALAWLRLPRSPREADALGAWTQSLDPQHAPLQAAVRRIRGAAASSPVPNAMSSRERQSPQSGGTRAGGTAAGQIQPRRP